VVTFVSNSIAFREETGQTMAEYAVVLGVITLAIVTTFSFLSDAIAAGYDRTLDILTAVV
jgi:Flp pilus assembly pilin Flp